MDRTMKKKATAATATGKEQGAEPARTMAKKKAMGNRGTGKAKPKTDGADKPKAKGNVTGTAASIRNGGESRPEQDRRGRFVKATKEAPADRRA
jgi:hypothetical protein